MVIVTAEGFRSEQGLCRLLLFESKKGFPDAPKYARLSLNSTIKGNIVLYSFKVLPGKYAISILHDENSNGKMDKTWYGKPKEGFGTSNNPKIGFSTPEFAECCVNLTKKENHINIKINYL
jgi:uncharacterized protein (DUF2141 family)